MKSLFNVLREENLTTLKIRYDHKTGAARFYAAREWDDSLNFARYNKDFCLDGIYTDEAIYFNSRQTAELYRKYGMENYLAEVISLLREGRHFGIDAYYFAKYDIRFMMHEHSRKLGLLNKSHAIMAGGIRRHEPEEEEIEVIIDGLNLGRGMSFKNVAGKLPFGGCKATVQMPPLNINDLEIMGFLAFALDACRDMTGPDMNFPTEMSDVMIKEGFSRQYTGGPSAKTGETGRPTAYGVYLTLKEALSFYEGDASLKGKSVALMGLGAVGWYMGEHLLKDGASLTVADINGDTARKFKEAHSGENIKIAAVNEIITAAADIFCPCAIGGIIHEGNIAALKCKYIWGSANNQLKASSQEEEIRLANLLARRGIIFQTEWWHNTAGVMCGAEEYLYDGDYESLMAKIKHVLPANTRSNLEKARALGITPTECAYITCGEIIYGNS